MVKPWGILKMSDVFRIEKDNTCDLGFEERNNTSYMILSKLEMEMFLESNAYLYKRINKKV